MTSPCWLLEVGCQHHFPKISQSIKRRDPTNRSRRRWRLCARRALDAAPEVALALHAVTSWSGYRIREDYAAMSTGSSALKFASIEIWCLHTIQVAFVHQSPTGASIRSIRLRLRTHTHGKYAQKIRISTDVYLLGVILTLEASDFAPTRLVALSSSRAALALIGQGH